MSKISVAGVRTNVQQLLEHSTEKKKRNFLETVYLPSILLLLPSPFSLLPSPSLSLCSHFLILMSDQTTGRAANWPEELRSAAR